MAFDIQRTKRSVPGRSRAVLSNIDPDIGLGQLARSVGQLGGALQKKAIVDNRLEAENHYSESERQAKERLDLFEDEVKAEIDTKKYGEMSKQALTDMAQYAPKNKLANRAYQRLLNKLKASMPDTVRDVKNARGIDEYRANVAAKMAQGKFKQARKMIRKGVNLYGAFTKEEAAKEIAESHIDEKDFYHKKEVESARQFAMRYPEELLEAIGPEDKIEGYVTLTPGDVMNIRAIARGQIAENKRQQDVAKQAEASELWDLLITPGSTLEEGVKKIDAMQYHDGIEKGNLMTWLNQRLQTMAKRGVDPLVNRQNHERYWELYQRAADGKTTESQARTAVNKGDITINDYKELVNVLDDKVGDTFKTKAQEIAATMKEMDGFFGDIDEADYDSAKAVRAAKIKARHILEGKIKDAEQAARPLVGIELTKEMLRVQRKVEKELLRFATAEQILPAKKELSKADNVGIATMRAFAEAFGKALVTTQEEYDALPKGALFMDLQGNTRMKP